MTKRILLTHGPTGRHRRRCELAWHLFDEYVTWHSLAEADHAIGSREHATARRERAELEQRVTRLFGPRP